MNKVTLVWIFIALLGVIFYILPVFRKSFEGFSTLTGSSSADQIATSLEEQLMKQQFEKEMDEEEKTTKEYASLYNSSINNMGILSTNTGLSKEELTSLFEKNETSSSETSVSSTISEAPIFNRNAIQKLITVLEEVKEYNRKNPNFKFSERVQNRASLQLKEIDSLLTKLRSVLSNNAWSISDTNIASKVNTNDLFIGYNIILQEYKKGNSSGSSSEPLSYLPITEAQRITVEIIKKTLEDLKQLHAKYKNYEFKNSVKAENLIKQIPEMEVKLSGVLKDGWELTPAGRSFRDSVLSGSIQKDYDAIYEELKSRDANAAIHDMKDLWKKQTGQELPVDYDMTKSVPASCKITQQYITTPSELQGMVLHQTKKSVSSTPARRKDSEKCPDLRNYIHKSKLPDMSQYIRKDSIPCWSCKL